ncbi:hypothetical protein M0R45_016289 [Rubus argutus]|uniref:Uncharacterized protein n=1 Tax=Rubus argutus TaxID=59490 RepID=A0AAW1XUL1_RUBAR
MLAVKGTTSLVRRSGVEKSRGLGGLSNCLGDGGGDAGCDDLGIDGCERTDGFHDYGGVCDGCEEEEEDRGERESFNWQRRCCWCDIGGFDRAATTQV